MPSKWCVWIHGRQCKATADENICKCKKFKSSKILNFRVVSELWRGSKRSESNSQNFPLKVWLFKKLKIFSANTQRRPRWMPRAECSTLHGETTSESPALDNHQRKAVQAKRLRSVCKVLKRKFAREIYKRSSPGKFVKKGAEMLGLLVN